MMDKLKLAEQTLINDEYPEFKTGDTVVVHYRVREGDKERIQKFEGLVISRRGTGANQTFMVRKISAGNIGVERIFPLHSPFVAKIELKRQGDIKRSKLYYLRERQGKSARVKEKDQNQDNVRELNRKAEEKAAAKQKADEEE
ncbi:50S ribosomal protein L19 [Aliifodinibius salipaludis]|uniref:Large ribosomal subunit protein bL19 n=2 Tax=Fodinibius salipaludis TaxID=2032627 RepID=A0A2A2GEE0_9BACT|nr:50S ribosomal protein L19 [Aliifodinibius salipaludis]